MSVASRLAPAKTLFARIAAADGGFTYHPLTEDTGIEPIRGYAVSPYPHLSFAKPSGEFTIGDLAAYFKKNKSMLKNANHFIGAWHDPSSGRIFLDVSVVTNSSGTASKLAVQHDQIAYFDLGRGKSVTVNKLATSGGAAL